MIQIHLTPKVEEKLASLLSKGTSLVRVTKKAQVLRLVGQGVPVSKAAEAAGVCRNTATTTCRRFQQGGLDSALYDRPRPGHAWLLDSNEEARIVAMVCSASPPGLAVWTIAVIAQEAVRRKLVKTVSKSTIVRLLQRHALKPWREKNVVCSKSQSRVYRMHGRCSEDVRNASVIG